MNLNTSLSLSDTNVELISKILHGKNIAIVAGGGVGAVEIPRIARELRRHGANIQFFITQKCLDFIGKKSLEWASQNPVIVEPTGLSEHICTYDALLVAPATTDLISKAAHGICSDGATTLLQSAFGMGVPVIFLPSMHESLYKSKIVENNCDILKKLENVFFITPRQEEGKNKILCPKTLALTFSHLVNKYFNQIQNKKQKKVIITFGGTQSMIDPVRCVTNLSSGKLGWEVVKLFYAMGIHVTALQSHTNFTPNSLQHLNLETLVKYNELYDFLEKMDTTEIDGVFHFVAASDFEIDIMREKKISSTMENLQLDFKKSCKIIELPNLKNIPYKSFCKLTSDMQEEDKELVLQFMNKHQAQSLFWNTPQSAWNKQNIHSGYFITQSKEDFSFLSISEKKEIAKIFYENFTTFLKG